jgi:hypothetical protein
VGNAIRFLDSGWHLLGYAAGFATGTVVGHAHRGAARHRLCHVRIVSRYAGVELADALRALGFGVTEFAGQGRDGRVEVVYTVCLRRDIPRVTGRGRALGPAGLHHRGGAPRHPLGLDARHGGRSRPIGPGRHERVRPQDGQPAAPVNRRQSSDLRARENVGQRGSCRITSSLMRRPR